MTRQTDIFRTAYSLTKRLNALLVKEFADAKTKCPAFFEIEGGSSTGFRITLQTKLGGRIPLWDSAQDDEEAEKKEILRRAFHDLDTALDALRETFPQYELKTKVVEEDDED